MVAGRSSTSRALWSIDKDFCSITNNIAAKRSALVTLEILWRKKAPNLGITDFKVVV